MLRITKILTILTIFVLVLVGSASANSGVVSGTIIGWPETSYLFYFDDFVSVDSDIVAWWSIMNVDLEKGYFYVGNDSTEVARVLGITDICEVTDATTYDYVDFATGVVEEGGLVIFHNTTTGYYAAFRVDDIYGPSNPDALVDVTWYLQENGSANFGPCEMIVQIDIKPGSGSNLIKLSSPGAVSVAVLTTEDFDASTIDPVTVLFAGASPLSWNMKDVDRDGDMDLLFQFKIRELELDENSREATLTGMTFDGISILGEDAVRVR